MRSIAAITSARRSFRLRPAGICLRAMALVLLAALIGGARSLLAQEMSVSAAIESSQVYLGQPFVLQLQVQGSDDVEQPDLSGLEDFQVQEAGGGQNNSQSISIINGKVNRTVKRGYTFNYRLTPQRTGELTIPSIRVTAEGESRMTQPIRVRVMPPEKTDDFQLRVELSEQRCYVGQPVILTVTWYVGRNVEEYQINVPILDDPRFEVNALDPEVSPAQQDEYVRISLGSGTAIGRKSRTTLDGRQFLTVRFEKVLIPKRAGVIELPQSTVSLRAIGGNQRRGGSVFDDMFGGSFFGRRSYQDYVIPSNTPTLQVSELPAAGRPADFTGLVGRFSLEADATPTSLSVGDPITLTLRVQGPRYLDNVNLPRLEKQPVLARDFRIPEERATGIVRGTTKVFTQTIRATHSGVSEIPAIELPYFDPDTGSYEIARSEPISLKVEGNRIITAQDAEGRDAGETTQNTELEARREGIAHNYDGEDVLVNQARSLSGWLGSPFGLALLIVPPLGYGALWAFIVVGRQRDRDYKGRRARRAHRDFTARMQSLDSDAARNAPEFPSKLLEALRDYLGARLHLPPGALTFSDVSGALEQRGAGAETIAEMKRLFEQCEAARYAGGFGAAQDPAQMIERARQTCARLEQELR